MVIEEHMTRKKEKKDEHGRFKNSSSTGNRGFIFQTESSPRQNGMKQKTVGLIEDAIEKKKAKWKSKESEEAEETEMKVSDCEIRTDEESAAT